MPLDILRHFVGSPDQEEVEFNTQEDDRVCPICKEFENTTYDADDDSKPEIPVHLNCRCFYIDAETGEEIPSLSSADVKGRKITFKMQKASMASMPFGKYRDIKHCVEENSDKEDPYAYCSTIMRKVEGASADNMKTELYAHDNHYYAKFFLINPFKNMRNWQVTEASIPKYIKTFIGQPYVDDKRVGERAHFGAQPDWPIEKILQEQEKYRDGTILDTAWFPESRTAVAAVELNKETFNSLMNGEAVYVSPAVAGAPQVLADGTLLYDQWFGLHLARVDRPAYGVFAATIRETCTGTEKECVTRLLAHASASLGKTTCEMMKEFGLSSLRLNSGNQNPDMGTDPTLDQLKQEIASLQGKIKDKDSKIDELTARAASADKLQKDFDELKAGIAAQERTSLAEEIVTIQVADGLIAETEKSKTIQSMSAELDKKALKTMLASAKAYHLKLKSESQPSQFYNPQETFEVLQTASMASEKQIPKTLKEAREMGWL